MEFSLLEISTDIQQPEHENLNKDASSMVLSQLRRNNVKLISSLISFIETESFHAGSLSLVISYVFVRSMKLQIVCIIA